MNCLKAIGSFSCQSPSRLSTILENFRRLLSSMQHISAEYLARVPALVERDVIIRQDFDGFSNHLERIDEFTAEVPEGDPRKGILEDLVMRRMLSEDPAMVSKHIELTRFSYMGIMSTYKEARAAG